MIKTDFAQFCNFLGRNIENLAETFQPFTKPGMKCDKIRYISVAHMFAEAISHIYMETSVSPLFL